MCRKFTLRKAHWDSMHLDRIDQVLPGARPALPPQATDPSRSADLAAVIMQEGLAQVTGRQ